MQYIILIQIILVIISSSLVLHSNSWSGEKISVTGILFMISVFCIPFFGMIVSVLVIGYYCDEVRRGLIPIRRKDLSRRRKIILKRLK